LHWVVGVIAQAVVFVVVGDLAYGYEPDTPAAATADDSAFWEGVFIALMLAPGVAWGELVWRHRLLARSARRLPARLQPSHMSRDAARRDAPT